MHGFVRVQQINVITNTFSDCFISHCDLQLFLDSYICIIKLVPFSPTIMWTMGIILLFSIFTSGQGVPCSEGEAACAGQPEVLSSGETTYCCPHALQAMHLHTVNGAQVCSCLALP
ncbi:hypothetical protein V1264_012479 [Littorina saxatilis]|uniref:Uncharacterized protein n=1 Tax=Littorina saxatilis TaxID=31220 RepID=A0AAN9GLJ4_9CAEN